MAVASPLAGVQPTPRRDYTASAILGVVGMGMVLTGCGLLIWSRRHVMHSPAEGQHTATRRMARRDECGGAEEAGGAGAELYELNDAAKAAARANASANSLALD